MDKMTVGIRRAVSADIEVLEALRARCFEFGLTPSMAEHLTAPNTFTYLAEDTSPFGFVTVGSCEIPLADGEILEWCLLPEHRERAIGRKLFVHGLSVLKRRMCESALIWIPANADRAEVIIRRQGFELSGATRERTVSNTTIQESAWTRDLSDFF